MNMTRAWLVVILGFVAGCGGAAPTTAGPAAPVAEDFGPGFATHESSVEALSKDAIRFLAASYNVAPGDSPGLIATEWDEHDARRWPGAQTRVVVEITAAKVIVRVQCRVAKESCARTMPEEVQLVALAQSLANGIAWGREGAPILAKMREFTDQVCACRDGDCVHAIERTMMEWALENIDMIKAAKPTRAQDEEADRIEARMDACKAKLEPEPEPPPIVRSFPAGKTGSPECDDYLATYDKVVGKCAEEIGPALDAMKQSRDAMAAAFAEWQTLDDASFDAVVEASATGCRSARDAIRQSARAMGCKL